MLYHGKAGTILPYNEHAQTKCDKFSCKIITKLPQVSRNLLNLDFLNSKGVQLQRLQTIQNLLKDFSANDNYSF